MLVSSISSFWHTVLQNYLPQDSYNYGFFGKGLHLEAVAGIVLCDTATTEQVTDWLDDNFI